MKKAIFIYLTIGCVILCTNISCNKENKLSHAFKLAGKNEAEIKKVIDHYSVNQKDSLKLKSAVFLIENMPGHYSYHPDSISEFKEQYMEIFKRNIDIKQKKKLLQELSNNYPTLNENIVEDISIISSDYLIYNIDKSFEIWDNSPYCQHLDFDNFCELILPYKVAELQELDDWKEVLAKKYGTDKNNMSVRDDESSSNPYVVSQRLTIDMRANMNIKHIHDYQGYTIFNSTTLSNLKFGTCENYSISAIAILRSKGIPACYETLPQWAQRRTGHGWHSILNINGMYLPSPWNLESLPGDIFFPTRNIPKIHRHKYAADPFIEEYLDKSKLKLKRFNKFQEDITDSYISTTDLCIPIDTKFLKEDYIYLAMYNNTDWNIVGLGKARNGKAHISKVGKNIAYIVLGYNGQEICPISDAFILNSRGIVKYCIPNKDNETDITVYRKYPKSVATAITEGYIVGGQLQAANIPDFSDADTIYVIKDLLYPDLIAVDTTTKYRYWRYSQTTQKSMFSIAELEFYPPYSTKPLQGDIIGKDLERGKSYHGIVRFFDGDWLTSHTLPKDFWIGFDFGMPTSIENIRIVPRSDDNGIHYGDYYELKYWDKEWIIIEEQQAQEKFLTFKNVPSNALLLLSNLTRGKEEHIFTYEHDQQLWW